MADTESRTLWVGLRIPKDVADQIAIADGEPADTLHLTLAFAPGDGLPEEAGAMAQAMLQDLATQIGPIEGIIGGLGIFSASESSDGKDVLYASFDSPALPEIRQYIINGLIEFDIPVSMMHGFCPHITLKYLEPGGNPQLAMPPRIDVSIPAITVDDSGAVEDVQLGQTAADEQVAEPTEKFWRENWDKVLPAGPGRSTFVAHAHWAGLTAEEAALPFSTLQKTKGDAAEIVLRFATANPRRGFWAFAVRNVPATASGLSSILRTDAAFRSIGPASWMAKDQVIVRAKESFHRYEMLDAGSYRVGYADRDRIELDVAGCFARGQFAFSRHSGAQWILSQQLPGRFSRAPMKTEGGYDFPAAAYAYVPDPEKPSTWKLRIWETPEKKETPRQVGMAVAAVGASGFRGNQADIPGADRPAVLAKLRAAWRAANPDAPPDEMPKVLKGSHEKMIVRSRRGQPELLSFGRTATFKVCVLKSEEVRRYTLGVAYPANEVDSYGDFMTPDELEQAAWRFTAKSRNVGLEHEKGTDGAGEVVESYIYRGPDWKIGDQVVKAGDWLLGVIWDQEVWDREIATGKMTGYSMQGMAFREPAKVPA